MAQFFQYTAVDRAGKKHSGEIEMGSRTELIRHLQMKGMRPVSVKELEQGKKSGAKADSNEPVTLKMRDLIAFTEELSELLEAGLPLEPALASMEGRDENGPIQEASGRLRRMVTEGEQMYQSLPRVSPQFDHLYCNLVKAGEASGSLQAILKQHGEYLKEQQELRSRLKQAMIYPACLIFVCIVVTLIFIFYLLPQITTLLSDMPGSEMPLGVRLATAVGDVLRAHWITILIGLVALVVGAKVWHQVEENKAKWDEMKLKLPLAGDVILYGLYVQWLQTLGNLLHNGVPLVQGLQLTAETISNRHFKERLAGITEQVGDGYRLTRCMRQTEMFPPNMVDLIGVGESTGKLARALTRATDYYDKRLSILIKSILSLISPVVLLAMAVLVGLLSYTMIQAIYETIGSIKK